MYFHRWISDEWMLNELGFKFGCIHSVELFALCKAFKDVVNLLPG